MHRNFHRFLFWGEDTKPKTKNCNWNFLPKFAKEIGIWIWFFSKISHSWCGSHIKFFQICKLKFGLSEKHTKFKKKSFSWFGRLLSKCAKHEEDCEKFCVPLRKSELYVLSGWNHFFSSKDWPFSWTVNGLCMYLIRKVLVASRLSAFSLVKLCFVFQRN